MTLPRTMQVSSSLSLLLTGLATGCSAPPGNAEPSRSTPLAAQAQALTDVTLTTTLYCVQEYVEAGKCDWTHWSEMYSKCETHRFTELDDGAFLDAVKAGRCTAAEWPQLRAEVLGTPVSEESTLDGGPTAVPVGFRAIVMSDTQVGRYWNEEKAESFGGGSDEATAGPPSKAYQKKLVQALNYEYGGGARVPVIINGDLTEYGHPWQLRSYKYYYDNPEAAGANDVLDLHSFDVYPGLGNHDYANNVRDYSRPSSETGCGGAYRNSCPKELIDYLYDRVAFKPGVTHVDWDTDEKRGSLAYSWDVQDIHFVQLNNYPTYEKTVGTDGGAFRAYHIRSAIRWLERDLARAYSAGKAIILNYHDADEHFTNDSEFIGLIDRYKVSAIFAGHFHDIAMKLKTLGTTKVPVFTSGSVMDQPKIDPRVLEPYAGDTYYDECGAYLESRRRSGGTALSSCSSLDTVHDAMFLQDGRHRLLHGTFIRADFGESLLVTYMALTSFPNVETELRSYEVPLHRCTKDCGTPIESGACTLDGDCKLDEYCDRSAQNPGSCVSSLGNNNSCLWNSMCASKICSAGLCAQCVEDAQCPPDQHCNVVGDCIPDRGNNGSCINDGECQSNLCISGLCAECDWSKRTASQCGPDKHCNVTGDCIPNRSNNGSCSANFECQSGICISGLCAQCRWGKSYDQCSGGKRCNVFGDCI